MGVFCDHAKMTESISEVLTVLVKQTLYILRMLSHHKFIVDRQLSS